MKALLMLIIAVFALGDAKLNANITAVTPSYNALFVGTDAGEVLRYDLASKQLDTEHFSMQLDKVKNYMAGVIGARIHSLDERNGRFLIVSEGDFGTQNVSVCSNFKIKQGGCTTIKSPFTNIKKAFFIDYDTALFALLSSDIKLVKLNGFKPGDKSGEISVQKEFKFSITSLNDIALSADNSQILVGTESGELQIFGIKEWKVLANYDKINKDTIDQVDYKNGIVVSCSKERKLGLVIKGEQKFEQKPYLIYSCALSPSGQIAAYSMLQADNYNSTTTLVQTRDFKALKNFDNGRFFAKFIVFTSENEFIVAGDKAIITRGVK